MMNDGLTRVMLGLLLCLTGGLVACGPSETGAFDDKGYQHMVYGYRVNATHPPDSSIAHENLLGNDWKLDNFYYNDMHSLVQKRTEPYMATYDFDTNDDGKSDFSQEDFLYDLRFKHLKRDAIIWLRTMPLSSDLKDKELRVLVQRYIDEVSGAGFEAVKLGPTTTIIREKRFGASIVDRGAFKLAEQDAYETTFDVANVDEIAVNPNARRVRVRIVLVRTPFEYTPESSVWTASKPTHVEPKYSVLMLAGYANLPEDFATDEPEFQHFLEQTVIAGKRGTTAVALETAASSTSPSSKPAAPSTEATAPGTESPAPTPATEPALPAAPTETAAPAPAP